MSKMPNTANKEFEVIVERKPMTSEEIMALLF